MLRIGQAQASQAKALRCFCSGATFFVAAKKRTSGEKQEKRTSDREKRTSKVMDLIYVKDRLGLGQPGQGATLFLQRRYIFCSGKVRDLIYVKDRLGLGQPGQGATLFLQRRYIFCSGKVRDLIYVKDRLGLGQPGQGGGFFFHLWWIFSTFGGFFSTGSGFFFPT